MKEASAQVTPRQSSVESHLAQSLGGVKSGTRGPSAGSPASVADAALTLPITIHRDPGSRCE